MECLHMHTLRKWNVLKCYKHAEKWVRREPQNPWLISTVREREVGVFVVNPLDILSKDFHRNGRVFSNRFRLHIPWVWYPTSYRVVFPRKCETWNSFFILRLGVYDQKNIPTWKIKCLKSVINMHIHTLCMYVCMYVCMCVCVCVCMHVRM